jgi:hypothetical protein
MDDGLAPCPRCAEPLVAGTGALGEAACAGCGVRFLDAPTVEQVRELFLKIEPSLFHEMARAGVPSAACPRCRTSLRVQRVRSVTVDLCIGCGGMLLDPGELLALSRGAVAETRAETGAETRAGGDAGPPGFSGGKLELARAPRSAQSLRWIVPCTSCDRELDLSATNFAVNDRPWCPECVADHGLSTWRHILAMSLGPFVALLSFLFGAAITRGHGRGFGLLRRRAPLDLSPSIMNNVVVGKVAPEQALKTFSRFARQDRS